MRLTDGRDTIVIEAARFPTNLEGRNADPDVLLNVSVQLQGYSANDQSWIVAREWCAFVHEFSELERTRRGEAVLLGVVPNELTFRFFVYSATGHTALEGQLARRGPFEHQSSLLKFEMRFDPEWLHEAAAEFRSYRKCEPQ